MFLLGKFACQQQQATDGNTLVVAARDEVYMHTASQLLHPTHWCVWQLVTLRDWIKIAKPKIVAFEFLLEKNEQSIKSSFCFATMRGVEYVVSVNDDHFTRA